MILINQLQIIKRNNKENNQKMNFISLIKKMLINKSLITYKNFRIWIRKIKKKL